LTNGGSSTVHIWLTPGGSSTAHIYTQTMHRIENKSYIIIKIIVKTIIKHSFKASLYNILLNTALFVPKSLQKI
jgi:hypothetical protein